MHVFIDTHENMWGDTPPIYETGVNAAIMDHAKAYELSDEDYANWVWVSGMWRAWQDRLRILREGHR